MNLLKRRMHKVHFTGIGGIGMSGIARLFVQQGFTVSGSDLMSSAITKNLKDCGCKIQIGHKEENVEDVDVLVYSSAVSMDNPEVKAAIQKGIPVIRRAEMLAELMRMKEGIAIAGTHGKTTTTSLVGQILTVAGLDPTVVVGGVLHGLGTNARLGKSDLLVAEADEYDRSFLRLTPVINILTTLEAEHLDTYENYENLREAFITFANSVPFYGLVVLCMDEPNLVDILPEIRRPVLTYGFNPQADIRADNVQHGVRSTFTVFYKDEKLGDISIPIAGKHNISNALAAVAVARELDIPMSKIAEALTTYEGVKRRFELRGEAKGVAVYDDYAHHPTEVRATLSAARNSLKKRIIAVFQPHLYSRTQTFYKEFAQELLAGDIVVITDVYPAREKPVEGVTGEMVAEQAKRFGHKQVHYVEDRAAIADYLKKLVQPGDAVITLGAGDIYKTSDELLEALKAE